MKKLDGFAEHRRALAARYDALFADMTFEQVDYVVEKVCEGIQKKCGTM